MLDNTKLEDHVKATEILESMELLERVDTFKFEDSSYEMEAVDFVNVLELVGVTPETWIKGTTLFGLGSMTNLQDLMVDVNKDHYHRQDTAFYEMSHALYNKFQLDHDDFSNLDGGLWVCAYNVGMLWENWLRNMCCDDLQPVVCSPNGSLPTTVTVESCRLPAFDTIYRYSYNGVNPIGVSKAIDQIVPICEMISFNKERSSGSLGGKGVSLKNSYYRATRPDQMTPLVGRDTYIGPKGNQLRGTDGDKSMVYTRKILRQVADSDLLPPSVEGDRWFGKNESTVVHSISHSQSGVSTSLLTAGSEEMASFKHTVTPKGIPDEYQQAVGAINVQYGALVSYILATSGLPEPILLDNTTIELDIHDIILTIYLNDELLAIQNWRASGYHSSKLPSLIKRDTDRGWVMSNIRLSLPTFEGVLTVKPSWWNVLSGSMCRSECVGWAERHNYLTIEGLYLLSRRAEEFTTMLVKVDEWNIYATIAADTNVYGKGVEVTDSPVIYQYNEGNEFHVGVYPVAYIKVFYPESWREIIDAAFDDSDEVIEGSSWKRVMKFNRVEPTTLPLK